MAVNNEIIVITGLSVKDESGSGLINVGPNNVNAPNFSASTGIMTSFSATTFYSGSTDLSLLLGSGGGSGGTETFTNSGGTPVTVAGIPAGSTFLNQTMTEMWNALLYPYQSPGFSSFLIVGQSLNIEVGDEVPSGITVFNWSTSNSSNVSANTITIKDNTSSTTLASNLPNVSSTAVTINSIVNTVATSNTWGIVGFNSHNISFSDTFSVNWRYRVYYGTSASSPLSSAQIISLASSSLATTFAGTFAFGPGDYKYFTYPSSFGTATNFVNTANSFTIPMENVYVVSVTNTFGVTVNYNVHRSTNILGGSINIQVS